MSKSKTLKINAFTAYNLFIALLPILANFVGPFGLGLGTCLLGLFSPYAFKFAVGKGYNKAYFPTVLMLLFFVARFNGHVATLLLLLVAIVNVAGVAKGAADLTRIQKYIEIVAVISTALVFLQFIGYYVFGIRINYLIEALLQDEFKAHLSTDTGSMYRPSALFLEPSHYAQYCCVALFAVLFPNNGAKPQMKKALWIALGCILTTSGTGIILVVATFVWFAVFHRNKKGKRTIPLLFWVVIGIVILVGLWFVPFFQSAVRRIVGEVDGYNAIQGRLGSWSYAILQMRGSDIAIGYGADADYIWYLTGFMKIIYRYGMVGLGLFIFALLRILRVGRDKKVYYMVFSYIGMMFFADLSNVFSMVFYLGMPIMLCRGKSIRRKKKALRTA